MSITRTCCNKELVTSCIYGCDNHYCANSNENIYIYPQEMSCSGYVNKYIFSALLREEGFRRDAEECSNTY